MGERIDWSLTVEVDGGPRFLIRQQVQVEAYDQIQIVVPEQLSEAVPGTATVSVQPVEDVDKVKLILISSDRYDPGILGGGPSLTMQAWSEPAGGVVATRGKMIRLEAPIHLVRGAVALLGAVPERLDFKNSLGPGKSVTITILVGRQAI